MEMNGRVILWHSRVKQSSDEESMLENAKNGNIKLSYLKTVYPDILRNCLRKGNPVFPLLLREIKVSVIVTCMSEEYIHGNAEAILFLLSHNNIRRSWERTEKHETKLFVCALLSTLSETDIRNLCIEDVCEEEMKRFWVHLSPDKLTFAIHKLLPEPCKELVEAVVKNFGSRCAVGMLRARSERLVEHGILEAICKYETLKDFLVFSDKEPENLATDCSDVNMLNHFYENSVPGPVILRLCCEGNDVALMEILTRQSIDEYYVWEAANYGHYELATRMITVLGETLWPIDNIVVNRGFWKFVSWNNIPMADSVVEAVLESGLFEEIRHFWSLIQACISTNSINWAVSHIYDAYIMDWVLTKTNQWENLPNKVLELAIEQNNESLAHRFMQHVSRDAYDEVLEKRLFEMSALRGNKKITYDIDRGFDILGKYGKRYINALMLKANPDVQRWLSFAF